jgi:copper(I)-binding protein
MTRTLFALAAVAALLTGAGAHAGEAGRAGAVVVADPWARASLVAGRPGAAYFTLRNESAAADRLVGVAADRAGHAMAHATTVDAQGVARMEHLTALEIPPGGAVAFAPGGLHVMLMDLDAPLREGETLTLTLSFETGGETTVAVPVLGPAAKGPAAP